MNWRNCCLKCFVVCTYKRIKYCFVLDFLVTCECFCKIALIAQYITRRLRCNSAPVVCSPLLKGFKLSAGHRQRKLQHRETYFGLRRVATRPWAGASRTQVLVHFLRGSGTGFCKLVAAWCLLHKSQLGSGKFKAKTLFSRLSRKGNWARSD